MKHLIKHLAGTRVEKAQNLDDKDGRNTKILIMPTAVLWSGVDIAEA